MNTLKPCYRPARSIPHTGFILIELKFAVAIIGILAAMALPAYQDDVIRAQVAEGFTLARALQRAVADYYGHQGVFPVDNDQAGLPSPDPWAGQYVERIEVRPGALQIPLSSAAAGARRNTMSPATAGAGPAVSFTPLIRSMSEARILANGANSALWATTRLVVLIDRLPVPGVRDFGCGRSAGAA